MSEKITFYDMDLTKERPQNASQRIKAINFNSNLFNTDGTIKLT